MAARTAKKREIHLKAMNKDKNLIFRRITYKNKESFSNIQSIVFALALFISNETKKGDFVRLQSNKSQS